MDSNPSISLPPLPTGPTTVPAAGPAGPPTPLFKQGDVIVLQNFDAKDGSWIISRNGTRFKGKIRIDFELDKSDTIFPPTANKMFDMLRTCLTQNERDTIDLDVLPSIQQRQKGLIRKSPSKCLTGSPSDFYKIPENTKQFMQNEIEEIRATLTNAEAELKLAMKAYLEHFDLNPKDLPSCFSIPPTSDERAFSKLLSYSFFTAVVQDIPAGPAKEKKSASITDLPPQGNELTLAPSKHFQHKFFLYRELDPISIKQKDLDSMESLNFNVLKWLEKQDYESPILFIIHMFQSLGLIETFQIPHKVLHRFLIRVVFCYRDVPFHNFFHAFNVTHTMFYFLNLPDIDDLISPLQKLAMLIATLCHDCDHPGLNNNFQMKAQTRVSLLHKKSTLENHHLLQCMNLLSMPECNILVNLDPASKEAINVYIRHLILVTDMSLHAVVHRRLLERKKSIAKAVKNRSTLHEEDAILVICTLMKCADLSNEIRPNEMAQKWAKLVLSEFFKQAQKESELRLPVTPFMDQNKIIIAKEQINFITGLCMPLYSNLVDMFPSVNSCVDQMLSNRRIWQKRLNLFFASNAEHQKELSDVSIWHQKGSKGGWLNFMNPGSDK